MLTFAAVTSCLAVSAGPSARAQTPLPPEVQAVVDDLGVLSVTVPLWLARAMPGGAADPQIGVPLPGYAGTWGLRLILGQAALLSRFDEALEEISNLNLADSLRDLALPWAQVGLAGRWTPVDDLSLELGVRGLPPLTFCGSGSEQDGETVTACVTLLNINGHFAARWQLTPPDGGMPGMQLGFSGRVAFGSLDMAQQKFKKHVTPAATYQVSGGPSMSWLLGQVGVDIRFLWHVGPVLPFVGAGIDLTFGSATLDLASHVEIASAPGPDAKPAEVQAIDFAAYSGHPAIVNLRFAAGVDFELGAGFSLALQGGVTFLGFVSADDPEPRVEAIVASRPQSYIQRLRAGDVPFQAIPVVGLALDWHSFAAPGSTYFGPDGL